MEIQSVSASTLYSYRNIFSNRKQATANTPANFSDLMVNNSDTVAVSYEARNFFTTQSNPTTTSGNSATAVFDTDKGSKNLNIDDYFSSVGSGNNAAFSLRTLPPLLLPTQNNIKAMTRHISSAFPQFLAQNNIPSAPSSITYDSKGQIQLPSDYAYASELKQALANNPTMERELKTVYALSSHFVEMEKSYQFHQEYAAATQTKTEAVVAKYGHLFGDNRQYSTIALRFSEGGDMSIISD
jgi:hypothetical protein